MKRVVSFSIDTELIKELETVSWESRKSRSEYLEGIIKAHFNSVSKPKIKHKEMTVEIPVSEEVDLEAENEKLMKKRQEARKLDASQILKKRAEIKGLKLTGDIPSKFTPYSKEAQLGKRGAK